jgi:hypothetical protein
MKTPIRYILSREFDYTRMICSDAGPMIAADFGWMSAELTDEALDSDAPIVVDNRIPESETAWLRERLPRRAGQTYLRVVDDYGPENARHWWYLFVREMTSYPNIGVIHTYTPAEFVKSLMQSHLESKFIHAPYVYQEEKELPLINGPRKNRILFSGARDTKLYPERDEFIQKVLWSPRLRFYVRDLKHPGYPDIGQPLNHEVTGQAYLSMLGTYRFAFVSPARTQSEFLKYREFAYAGTCPVGYLPISLADCPNSAFIQFAGSTGNFLRSTVFADDYVTRAQQFRQYMREKRNRADIQSRLNAEILGNSLKQ